MGAAFQRQLLPETAGRGPLAGEMFTPPGTAELARSESLYRPLAVLEEREAERQYSCIFRVIPGALLIWGNLSGTHVSTSINTGFPRNEKGREQLVFEMKFY